MYELNFEILHHFFIFFARFAVYYLILLASLFLGPRNIKKAVIWGFKSIFANCLFNRKPGQNFNNSNYSHPSKICREIFT